MPLGRGGRHRTLGNAAPNVNITPRALLQLLIMMGHGGFFELDTLAWPPLKVRLWGLCF